MTKNDRLELINRIRSTRYNWDGSRDATFALDDLVDSLAQHFTTTTEDYDAFVKDAAKPLSEDEIDEFIGPNDPEL